MTVPEAFSTGVAHKIGRYSNAVRVPTGYEQIVTSGTPGLRPDGTLPDDFAEEARQAWRNVAEARGRVAGTSASAVLVFSAVTALGPKDASSYATLAAGMIVLPALIIGVVIALLLLVYQASRPRVSVLGADPVVPGAFADIGRHDGIVPVPAC